MNVTNAELKEMLRAAWMDGNRLGTYNQQTLNVAFEAYFKNINETNKKED